MKEQRGSLGDDLSPPARRHFVDDDEQMMTFVQKKNNPKQKRLEKGVTLRFNCERASEQKAPPSKGLRR